MEVKLTWVAVFVSLCLYVAEGGELTGSKNVMRAKVVSCTGCRLNKLHEVKRFIYNDVPLYHNVVFKPKPGAAPVLHFLNEKDESVEEIQLSDLNEGQCNDLLRNRGFFKKSHAGEEVPEKYEQGPYDGVKQEEVKNDL